MKKEKGDQGAIHKAKEPMHDDICSINHKEIKEGKGNKRENSRSVKHDDEREVDGGVETPKPPKRKSKKVRFSVDVEGFPSADSTSAVDKNLGKGLVRGKWFSLQEDELVKKAVYSYIEAHSLGKEGIKMILNCRSHPEVKNCWKEIAAALPWRPASGVYHRAHILFERADSRSWTPEELEMVKNFHKRHGPDWKTIAEMLGKHRFHVKDTWSRIKVPKKKKGQWSQEEYQTLFDLVNVDIQVKASMEKKSKHGMLKDNISWEAISEKLSTRTNVHCLQKWYKQLSSPMVAEGLEQC